jgi:hypothetical protein
VWRWSDSFFFKVPPLASNAFLTALHLLLKNVLQTVDHFEIFHGWKGPELHGVRSGLYDGCSNGVPPIHFFQAKQNSIQISPHAISGLFKP